MLDNLKINKKRIAMALLSAIMLFAALLYGCNVDNITACEYPNISVPYVIEFINNDITVQGEINYINSNNLTVTYLSPETVKGFSVAVSGDRCNLSFKDLISKDNVIPFAPDSPVDVVINAFECCEKGNARLLWSKTGQCCYTAAKESKEYKIICTAKTGDIEKIVFQDQKIDLTPKKEPAA
ncbi:MAG: hypothetical protein K6F76_00220 [Clostridiales bacterium]|nr:hypothetical protein [Clostridiales bacterium]